MKTLSGIEALTEREREVLELIVRGRTNAEIADLLGIRFETAKWHVSEILSKLHADSREEAAEAWRRHNGLASRVARSFRALAGALATKWAAGTAAVLVVGAAAAIVAIAINHSSDQSRTSDQEVPAAPLPTAAADVQAPAVPDTQTPGMPGSVQLTAPVPSIPDTVMYTVTGCYGCDGPDHALQRHVTDASGKVTSTTVLEPQSGILAGWQIGHYRAVPDGSVLAVVTCDGEYCGALGENKPVANWRVLVSVDGGITWSETARWQTSYASIGDVGRNSILVETYEAGSESPQYSVLTSGSARTVEAPDVLEPWSQPLLLPDDTVLWANYSRDGVFLGAVKEDGTPLPLSLPSDAVVAPGGLDVLADGTMSVLTNAGPNGGLRARFLAADGSPRHDGDVLVGHRSVFITPKLGLTNITGRDLASGEPDTRYPVLVDLGNGVATPVVADIFTQQRGRNRFIAFQTGPFATVTAGGDCLNVREQAAISATSLGCYRDRVLLRDLAETTEADGITWLKVATPDGRHGWASIEFLER